MRVLDALGDAPVAPGERGEIVARGPQLMSDYWQRPDETSHTLRGGWLHTGDVGRVDDDGYLFVEDRIKDMVVSGGENVFPRVVEDVLFAHPAIAEAAVIGVPDERWGEAVKAVVALRPGCTCTQDEILAFCRPPLGRLRTTPLGRLRRCPAPHRDREGSQARPARALLGRTPAPHQRRVVRRRVQASRARLTSSDARQALKQHFGLREDVVERRLVGPREEPL